MLDNNNQENFEQSLEKWRELSNKYQKQFDKYQLPDEMMASIKNISDNTRKIRECQSDIYSKINPDTKKSNMIMFDYNKKIAPAVEIMNSIHLPENFVIDIYNVTNKDNEILDKDLVEEGVVSEVQISNLFNKLEIMSEKDDFTEEEVAQLNEANRFLLSNNIDLELPDYTIKKQKQPSEIYQASLSEDEYSFARDLAFALAVFLGEILIFLLNQGQIDPMYALMIFTSLLTIFKPKNQ